MNANVAVLKGKLLDKKMAIGLALAVVAVGAAVYWVFFAEPAPAWRVKWRIQRYLKKQSGKSDFRVEFKFPSKAAMAKAPAGLAAASKTEPMKGELTKKDFATLRDEYMTLEKEVLLLQRDLLVKQKDIDMRQTQLAAREKQLAAMPTNSPKPRVTLMQSNLQVNVTSLRDQVTALQKDLAARQQALPGKEAALVPLLSDLWAFQRRWATQQDDADATGTNEVAIAQAELARETRRKLGEANTYEEMYGLIGQELWVADRLLPSANPQHRRAALALARQAGADALWSAQDSWLAARISEGYIWPNLDAAEYASVQAPLSVENLLNECANAFSGAEETNRVIRTYLLLIAKTKSVQSADRARMQLARLYENNGEFALALRCLKEMKDPNSVAWARRRLQWLEQRVKGK